MDKNEFIKKFAEQFDETDVSLIKADTEFRKFDEWSSLIGLCIVSMIKDEYGFFISPSEFKKCVTVNDVYNLVISYKA